MEFYGFYHTASGYDPDHDLFMLSMEYPDSLIVEHDLKRYEWDVDLHKYRRVYPQHFILKLNDVERAIIREDDSISNAVINSLNIFREAYEQLKFSNRST